MDSYDMGSVQDRSGNRCLSPCFHLGQRRVYVFAGITFKDVSYKCLSRRADENRNIKAFKFMQMLNQGKIMPDCLAKTDSRINNQL